MTLAERLQHWSRERKQAHFYSLHTPQNSSHSHAENGTSIVTPSILDVGVHADPHDRPMCNYFLKTFKYPDSCYTGFGIQNLSSLQERYPDKKFVYNWPIANFDDNEFDWIYCNAVIEHVGDRDAQVEFVKELLRVGKHLFLTTPALEFPIEPHTRIFLMHWRQSWFRKWYAKRHKDELRLLSRRALESIMVDAVARPFKLHTNRLLGWPMTYTVVR